MTALKKDLVRAARELGFDSCRVAACAPPSHIDEFRDWLGQGAAGEMAYMKRGEDKRCDPRLVLPGARSVIVLAMNYFTGEESGIGSQAMSHRQAADATKAGRIARYARGDDYHDVI